MDCRMDAPTIKAAGTSNAEKRPLSSFTTMSEEYAYYREHDGDDVPIEIADPWPAPPDEAAFYGLAGEIVRIIEPHSEADPVAVLLQLLVAFGNTIGQTAYFRAEADRHHGNLFLNLVGETSKGRKGSSWGQVGRVFAAADPTWHQERLMHGGLASGEGLIWAVRDPIYKREPRREDGRRGPVTGYEEVLTDPGVDDKRLLALESEFSSVLKVAARQQNTLSAALRQAWDSGNLDNRTKNSPGKATGAHISIVGHVTRDELRRLLTETDIANGLANRFLWICVRRSKCLPEGGNLTDEALTPLCNRLADRIAFAREVGEVRRDEAARAIWRKVYPSLSEGKAGLMGATTSRGEAQVMRLAVLYALLDRSPVIEPAHLQAALAVWEHAEASAPHLWEQDGRPDGRRSAAGAAGRWRAGQDPQRDTRAFQPAQERRRAWPRFECAGRSRSCSP